MICMKKGIPIVVSSPSGAGKTTLIRNLKKKVKGFGYSVSATTRPKSSQEIDGKDYFFLSEKDFLKRKKACEFVETAIVHGYYYGTLKSQLDKQLLLGKDVLMDLDVIGALNVKKLYPEALLIFIKAPSMKILEERIRKRSRDPEKAIQKRLRNARKELKYTKYYDYVIVNDILAEASKQFIDIIKTERMKKR
ncbi:MAG: Guanylate kinase [Elusimicrobia bacterium ADurb.Bin231]|nr:MAG: Guanylate kinase [Elusimicrobia bacterium ADurb.Bin231]